MIGFADAAVKWRRSEVQKYVWSLAAIISHGAGSTTKQVLSSGAMSDYNHQRQGLRDRRLEDASWTRSFWRDYGWLFLLASLLIHAAILATLPRVWSGPPPATRKITLELKTPVVPPPSPPPVPPEREDGRTTSMPDRRSSPDPEPDPVQQLQARLTDTAEPVAKPPAALPQDDPGAVPEPPAAIPDPPRSSRDTGTTPASPALPESSNDPQPDIDVQALLRSYAATVKDQVLAQKHYPSVAQRLGHAGEAEVGFTIAANGELAGLRLKRSSGWDELDDAALAAVRSAAPFDALPPASGRSELALAITLRFVLQ
jgi:protein TonB